MRRKLLGAILLIISINSAVPLMANAASNEAFFAAYCDHGGLSTAFAADNVLKCHESGDSPLFEQQVDALTTDPHGDHTVTIVGADCYPDTSQTPHAPSTVTDHIDCGGGPNATLTLGSTFPPSTAPVDSFSNGLTPIRAAALPQPPADSGSVSSILEVVFGIIGALALLMIVISGLRYITSAGDPQKISTAKNGIIYALVGLAVAITAEAIVALVVSNL